MEPEPRKITLESIAAGAAEELFEAAFAEALANIDDPNTDWKAKRRVTLNFTLACDEQRRTVTVEVDCGTKLAGIRSVGTTVFLGRHEGQLVGREALSQEELFPKPQGRPAAVSGGEA